MNAGQIASRKVMQRWFDRKKEVKTTMTKDDLRAMLEAFDGQVEVVAPKHVFYRFDMCKSKWTKKGGINLCNFVNPVERAKSVMKLLKEAK